MDDTRAHTLQALEAFIRTQRDLLARQRSDIEHLHRLRVDLSERPSHLFGNLNNELDHTAFRLSVQTDCRLIVPKGIDWTIFDKADNTPLVRLASRARLKQSQRTCPSLTQTSELSDLQKLVKRARVRIVDPILAAFESMSPATESDSSEDEMDPMELRRMQEREKIRELKKRKIRGCGLSLPSTMTVWGAAAAAASASAPGEVGVFVRNDVDDETAEVDIDVDEAEAEPSPQRTRKPTTKLLLSQESAPPKKTTIPKVKFKLKLNPPPSADTDMNTEENDTPSEADDNAEHDHHRTKLNAARRSRGAGGKPKPETYKQAWSMSEQNLLEQLLDEIPEGEKFRWQKISRAMGGRRTPRQVASRVQKYFEKLKKFGVEVDHRP